MFALTNEYCHVSVSGPPGTAVTLTSPWPPTDGNTTKLTCDITDSTNPRDVMKVIWRKGDVTLPTSNRYKLSGRVLTISSLDHTVDDGHYSCAAEIQAGMGDFSAKFQLQINCKYFHYNISNPVT